jgi:L-fucose dehydrogenase
MDLGLKGSVIAVTGGGVGIGQGISRICLAEGARVVVLSRNSEHVQKFLAETGRDGLPCELIVTELAETDQCRKAIEQNRHPLWEARWPGQQCRSQ